MRQLSFSIRLFASFTALLVLAACAPAAPTPTAAPPKPTEAPKPAAPTEAPNPAAPAAATTAPTALTTKPAAGAKPAFDEQAVAEFYRGKTIRIVVGFAPGGGYDLHSRLLSRHLGKYIPGNPTIVIDNMPGAATMTAMNHVYNNGPKDGTMIASVTGGVFVQQLFGNPSVQFDAKKVHAIGAPTGTTTVLVVNAETGVKKFEDLLDSSRKQIVLGGEAPGINLHDAAILLRDVVKANVKVVGGYQGSALIRKALEQGEVDGYFSSWEGIKTFHADDVKSGKLLALSQWTDEPAKDQPDVPAIGSFLKSDEERQLIRYGLILPDRITRPYVLAPEVPEDRVRALRAAFEKTMVDQAYLDDATQTKLEIAPIDGDRFNQYVGDLFAMPEGTRSKLQQILAAGGH